MLSELAESDARDEIAVIYQEIRDFCAVPYVSSLQRHLATRPGWLQWCWQSVRPVFVSGVAQNAAWAVAREQAAQPLPPVSTAVARLWGLNATDITTIRSVGELFVRVSPTNLMLSAMVKRLLDQQTPTGNGDDLPTWTPPPAVPVPPAMPAFESLDEATHCALMRFGTTVAGAPFVPGIYRMLANWPAFLGYLATVLAPRLDDPDTIAACLAVQARVDAAAEDVFQQLPASSGPWPVPPSSEFAEVIAAIDRYRETSPQMIVYGGLIQDCLEDAAT